MAQSTIAKVGERDTTAVKPRTESPAKSSDSRESPATTTVSPTIDEASAPKATARTTRDELADVIARAIRDGDFDLAARLVDALRPAGPPTASVVSLDEARTRRRS